MRVRSLLPLVALSAIVAQPLHAQEPEPATISIEPAEIRLQVGETLTLAATVTAADGTVLERPVLFFSTDRRRLQVNPDGTIKALWHGDFEVMAIVPNEQQTAIVLQRRLPVSVAAPAVASLEFGELPARLYAGSRVALPVRATDVVGNERDDVAIRFQSSDPTVATAGSAGEIELLAAGTVLVTVSAEGVATSAELLVEPNPVVAVELEISAARVRTGDVVRVEAIARDISGAQIEGLPVEFAAHGRAADGDIAPGAAAQITGDGRFVAERPGLYTVIAVAGGRSAVGAIRVAPREASRRLEVVGHAPVRDRHTSDLWVWEGVDGRDYAITGTWGSEGHAYVWDVSDAENMELIQKVQVDARTVNDVKVSEDGRLAVISREGASNRRNGMVILDVSDPRNGVAVISEYDDQLTGGVHNVFIHDEHVYALSAGRRYDIINIEDPAEPHRVGSFELETPGHSIHDVWVEDGIAYSSNWSDGVVAVDVGGGDAGGSPRNPVMLGSYAYPSGWNHAAFPYTSASTGKRYVFAGDEAFPYGLNAAPGSAPTRAAGWIHVIEWDDWDQPREVARYEVPEAGTHNLWIEDDIMYVAYYNGGLRVVDVSGELMGDLYRQGREIARFIPDDPDGYSANAPMVWGPQPYKGLIFISDWNSGLWAVRLREADGSGE